MDNNNVKRVVIIGPECTGKSELSATLADVYDTVWVREFAREYLDRLGRPYGEHDLKIIARGQLAHEDSMAVKANKVLISVKKPQYVAGLLRGVRPIGL